MADEQEQFRQILCCLLSANNDTRTQAEEAYNNIAIESRVTLLLSAILNDAIREEPREMAAVLLRRLFSAEFMDFYPKLSPEAQGQLREQILVAVQRDQPAGLRRKVCDIVAEVARNLIDDDGNNQWPEFLQFLFQCANSPTPEIKESALCMFRAVPGVFGNQQANYLDLIKQMLQQSLLDAANAEVRYLAVQATSAFVLLHEKEAGIQKQLEPLLPAMLAILGETTVKAEDETLLKTFVELAETTPKFLRPQLENICELCIKVFSDTNQMDAMRHLALEVIVTLSETAPAMLRRVGSKFIPMLIPQVLLLMTDLEDDDEWSVTDEIIEEDNDSNSVVAESALDRLACGLGGKTVLPHICHNISQMLNNEDWKYRHAALMAISAVGEGCHKQMESMLPQIMEGVLAFLQDPHPRVRYAACNAVGQMATDFAPIFEKKFHDKVVPGLLMVLDDSANPRVQAHAGAALVNFSEDCPKNILTMYLDAIMGKLEAILSAKFRELVEKGTKLVLEQVVTTIASVADTSEEQFVAYYDRLMPCLKYIIQNATTTELKLLRGKTIECVSLIGLAVGSEKFRMDANEVMAMLLKSQTEGDLPDDDPQTSYLISAWARMCRILGKDFEQYLPLVMGTVMKTASMKPEVAVFDNEDMETIEEDVDWQFVSLGEQQNFGIRTAGLEDKASACEMLVCYARELNEGFAPYAEEVVKLMVPLLKFYFHDGVRSAAAESLPYLLECAKTKGAAFVQGMWTYIWPELLKAIDTEPESDVLAELMYSLSKCIETLGSGCLTEAAMVELVKILDKLLKEHFEHAAARQEKRKDEDYDEVVEEQLVDEDTEDTYLLSKVSDVMHALFSTYKEAFFPYFDQVVGHYTKMLGEGMTWSDRQWALCVFDDLVEFCGPASVRYQPLFLQQLLAYTEDGAPEVRQAAVYGCGVMGQFGGPAYAPACTEALGKLMKVISLPESRSTDNINATENAISAVTKILKYSSSDINKDEVIPHWLSWLPVWEDVDEAPHIYGFLCDLVEANNIALLGQDNANVPRIVAVMAEAFARDALNPSGEVTQRMVLLLRHIQMQADGKLFEACVAQLNADQQRALHQVLSASPVVN